MSIDRCQWKLVESKSFSLGIHAERCGKIADVSVLRPDRKKDLFLCEGHLNNFILIWGLSHQVKLLCRCEGDENNPNSMNGIDWDDIPPVAVVADPMMIIDYNMKRGHCVHGRPECECWRGFYT